MYKTFRFRSYPTKGHHANLAAFALLNALDLLTTYIGGIQNETNPFGQAIIAWQGLLGLALGKVLLIAYIAIFGTLLRRLRLQRWASLYNKLVIGIYIVVVAWNIRYLILALPA